MIDRGVFRSGEKSIIYYLLLITCGAKWSGLVLLTVRTILALLMKIAPL